MKIKSPVRWLSTLGLALLTFAQARAGIAIAHWQQADGAKVYWVSNPVIPMVDVRIDFDAGSRRDPVGQEGLAAAAAELSLWGLNARNASPRLSPTQVSAAWADLGAQWSAFATSDRLSYTLRTLSEPAVLNKATELAARHFVDARFDVASWERLRSRWLADVRERQTRPSAVANQAFSAKVFGAHPYGKHFSEQSLNAIVAADIAGFHAQQLRACDAAITIVGALSELQATDLARRLTASLPAQANCPTKPTLPEPAPLIEPVSQEVEFSSAQTHVLLGGLGVSVMDPDLFALNLGNHILGAGGFTSRLTRELREKRGLTYGVSSGFSPGRQVGEFQISLQTRPEQAALALRVTREVLSEFVKSGPTEEEVSAAKAHLIGSFVLRLDSNLALRDSVASMAWNARPLDYLDTWTQRMNQVTRAEIQRAFQRVLGNGNWVSVVVGKAP